MMIAGSLATAATPRPGWAQAGLRGPEDVNDFPTSPTAATPLAPENLSPPSLQPSQSLPDEPTPPTTQVPPAVGAPNYGKPRVRKSLLYRPKPKLYNPNSAGNPPLSPLVPYRGAPGPQRRALNPVPLSANGVEVTEPGPTVAAIQSPLRLRKPLVELEPYVPTGIGFGAMRFLPFVEATTGYETNPNQVAVGIRPSAVLRAAGGLDMQSDFSNSSVTAALRGGYSEFPSNPNANRPDASGLVTGRIDVTRDDQIITEGRFAVATQTPGSPLLAVANSVYVTSRALITSEGATLGGVHRFNRLLLDLRGTFDRTQYGNATQSNGTVFPYSQYNYNDIGVVARASYELTPVLIPFVETGFDTRVHDSVVDPDGFRRDSTGVVVRAGSSFEFDHVFTGSLSAGYTDRHYADARLPNLRGPTVDGSIAYAITPLTTITLRTNTTLAETTLPGASGAISRLVSLEVAHVFFRHFTLSGIATYQPNDYQGVSAHETFTQFSLKGAYSLSREVQLIASVSRQELTSSLVGDNFRDYIFLAGVRLQR